MNFLKNTLAAFTGFLIGVIFLTLIGVVIVVSSSGDPEPYIRKNSVLKIEMSSVIPDRVKKDPLSELFAPDQVKSLSLESLKENLEKAAVHENIRGIWLELPPVTSSWAKLEEVRGLFKTFKKDSDKFIYAYTNDIGFNEKAYYLATVADSIFAPPETNFEFDGFFMQTAFYTGLFDKIGIEPVIFRKGKYKSAVEPYYLKEHSDASEYQLSQLVEEYSTQFVAAVAEKSGKTESEINQMLNDSPMLTVKTALEYNFVDSLIYPDEFEQQIKKRIAIEEDKELETVEHDRYAKVSKSSAGLSTYDGSDKIAVLYAEGLIIPQAASSFPPDGSNYITATKISEQLDEIREDDNIKALVVRINSPGGSGSTSDLIWKDLRRTAEKIPVIASMGNVAASGGYYIGMAADTIVAMPSTITGSIGVFGSMFNAKELFNDKLGITFDEVKSHNHADWLTATRDLTKGEKAVIQNYIDEFYTSFVTKVADARNLSYDQVHEDAQGRVWTGTDAKEQQLVDVLGNLDTALAIAAEQAGLAEFKVEEFPKQKDFLQALLSSTQTRVQAWMTPSWMQQDATKPLRDAFLLRKQEVLTLFPYQISVQ